MTTSVMQGVTLVSKPQDKTQPNQKIRGTSPNIIGNVEEQAPFTFGLRNMNIKPPVAEESKNSAISNTQKISMSQFMRNVHSKQDLLYALEVKGKHDFYFDDTFF